MNSVGVACVKYFFDIKSTRGNDYYLTITESKRRVNGDNFSFEKHKIFLYKEDFFKFASALNEAVDHIKHDLMPDFDFDAFNHEDAPSSGDYEAGNGQEVAAPAPAPVVATAAPVDAPVQEPTPANDATPASDASQEEVDKW